MDLEQSGTYWMDGLREWFRYVSGVLAFPQTCESFATIGLRKTTIECNISVGELRSQIGAVRVRFNQPVEELQTGPAARQKTPNFFEIGSLTTRVEWIDGVFWAFAAVRS